MSHPSQPNPLVFMGAPDPLDQLGRIDRSLRFRSTASSYLTRTPNSSGSRQKFTIRLCIKLHHPTDSGVIWSSGYITNGSSADVFELYHANGFFVLRHYNGSTDDYLLQTSTLFRDVTQHYDICVSVDSTQATVANRMILSVNGVIPNFTTNVQPGLNANVLLLTQPIRIGARVADAFGGYWGYLIANISSLVIVDGTALPHTAFGRVHPVTGQWRPYGADVLRSLANAGGVNSGYWDFSNTSSVAALGFDASSKGNNWTVNGFSLTAGVTYDSSLDTPTNSFCTLNPLQKVSSVTISYANLLMGTNATGYGKTIGTLGVSSGKYFWEARVTQQTSNTAILGIGTQFSDTYVGGTPGDVGVAYPLSLNDVAGVALDMDNLTVQGYLNGVAQGAPISIPAGTYFPIFSDSHIATTYCTMAVNFGQQPFAYTPPSGFKTLSTKNLTQSRVKDASRGFYSGVDTGANIVSTVNTATNTWSKWIRAYHRIGTTEDWRWVFSDDSTNYLSCPTASAKASFAGSLNAAANYECIAFNCDARFGINTGTITHVNGVSEVVTDGLKTARKLVILTVESGNTWFVYHPDCTAGSLLYLNGTNVETADTAISSVTSTGFSLGSSLPGGAYRWISFSETSGFLKLFRTVGNGSTDGPVINSGINPLFSFTKRIDSTANWIHHNKGRNPGNVCKAASYFNLGLDDTDSPNVYQDFLSNQIKWRHSIAPYNVNNGVYVGMIIGGDGRHSNGQ